MAAGLDIEIPGMLEGYLRETGRIEREESVATRVLTGGVSNRTVLVQRPSGEAWVVKQALEKLRVSVDWFSRPERIEREALGMRRLAELAPPRTVPKLIFEDPKYHLLAMEAVPEPNAVWKELLLAGRLEENHVAQFGHLLGTIHSNAYKRRDELQPAFADRSFFESLRLEPYYAYTATQVPEAATFLATLIADTREHSVTLVHGDYSPKNILVHEGRLILLDHEVIHFGEPAFDIGFSLAHFLSKANHVAGKRDAFEQAALQYWKSYQAVLADAQWQADLEARSVRHTLGCLLSRVAGKSPLEYLSHTERAGQLSASLELMRRSEATIPEMVASYLELLELENKR